MKELLISLLFLFLSAYSTLAQAQAPARTFTYDAAGNRITMGVPLLQTPRKTEDSVLEKRADIVSFTNHPGGHVLIHVLNGNEDLTYSARVYTTSGQIVTRVLPTTSPVSSIDLSSYQAGVYIIEVIIDDRHITHKIIRE
jgi:hypothetical protein